MTFGDFMQIFKIDDLNFKRSLTSKIIADLPEWYDEELKSKVMNELTIGQYFAVNFNYGYAGFLSVIEIKKEVFEISGIGIFKASQRNKCGKSLIDALKQYARMTKKELISVTIKDDDSKDINYLKTRRFFSKMDFKEVTKYYKEGVPYTVMVYKV